MMAGIFGTFALAMGAIYLRQRNLAIILTFLGIVFIAVMMWHHATDTLQINW